MSFGLLGGLVDFGFGVYDRMKQNEMNEQTLQMQQQANQQNQANFDKTFEYQKSLNLQTQQREDSAYQRAVADAEKAGLSKWAVAGNGASATAMSSASGGQSVANGAKVSSQISNTAYGAEMAQIRASTAQARAVTKEAEVRERQADAEIKHMKSQDAINSFRTNMDYAFGMRDRSLAERNLVLEEDKQREVASNNQRIIAETIRHNKAVESENNRSNVARETETHRANTRAEQQNSQSLDIKRIEALCKQVDSQVSQAWLEQQSKQMMYDKEYREQVVALEKEGLNQKWAQMVVSGLVDITKTVFIGYGATHSVIPSVVKGSANYQGNNGVGFHAD